MAARPKRQPQRSCVACRQAQDKSGLLRVVRAADRMVVDERGKLAGRGAYLCPNPACLERAVKTKALERALGVPLPAETIEKLREAVSRGTAQGSGNTAGAGDGGN